jgi:hypothetical protein
MNRRRFNLQRRGGIEVTELSKKLQEVAELRNKTRMLQAILNE